MFKQNKKKKQCFNADGAYGLMTSMFATCCMQSEIKMASDLGPQIDIQNVGSYFD